MFTPVETSLGALLLFQSSSGLLLHNGAVFGISSLLSGCVFNPSHDNVPIIAGLASSIASIYLFAPSLIPIYPSAPNSWASVASTLGTGFLLGWGTKNDRGCTSGHMLCGVSRLSPRSLIATAIFFATALLTANFANGGQNIPPCPTGVPCYTPTYPSTEELIFMISTVALTTLINFVIVPRFLHRSKKSRTVFSYLAGLQFGLGLFITGMADPAKVLRFFAVLTDPSRWDPSLMLIILFAVGPSLVTYLKAVKPVLTKEEAGGKDAGKPTLADKWRLPTLTVADIDWRFVTGAVAFGVAWGLRGVCPGPAVLRSILQPAWGIVEMTGYMLGNLL
ncbi:YeeE/YedE family protein [Aspergillus clavatus NRRL 1]|uniref:YeeE/YedE family integral membrane protein n=1 Tax=Aspergillus clavatus (strain ATCC 1007 / CBS 513.65 / DSM 816 / NCTC 3887 / NRRL 1 / QM 1276 / 107) TaxID=344612 RepID=A1CHD9_ASPCL|nr:YeeE/YedE family integral membrane protein [Aspergillus clavatus NRRL 1]EAW10294.1 YeeE/YedE family integral membrane protein [Aspergillus clavatus NRRL 1]